jgi:hypothetical protein
MPEQTATVSFTGLSPIEALPLMRWRARYRRMSFEPYGIGIDRSIAVEHGIDEVQYHGLCEYPASDVPRRWLLQSVGREGDWRQEREYRHLGDFDLHRVPREGVVLFCHHADEVDLLKRETELRVIPFLL